MTHTVTALLRAGQLLVGPDGRLPRVAEEDWPDQVCPMDPTAVLVSAIRRVPANGPDRPELRVHLMAARDQAAATPPGHRWVSPSELDALPEREDLRIAVQVALKDHHGRSPQHSLRPGWLDLAWHEEATSWADAELARLGRRRLGLPQPVKTWSLSTVLRLETAGAGLGAAFLKANFPHFAGEAAAIAAIAQFVPDQLPTLLATHAWQGWLLMEPLPPVLEDLPRSTLLRAARLLAQLQLRSRAHVDSLLAAGVRDRTEQPMIRDLEAVLDHGFELDRLTGPEQQSVRTRRANLVAAVRDLYATEVPVTLVHGDLHPGNIAADPGHRGRVVFYDWTDACVSHPFLDAAHLATWVARNEQELAAEEVWHAYLEPWRAALPGVDLTEAQRLSPLVNLLFQLVTYEGIYRGQQPDSWWELGRVQASMLRRLSVG